MDSFQQFLEDMPQIPLEERVIIFRHEALRPLNFAKGYAKLLELEVNRSAGMPEDAPQMFQRLLSSLDEIGQLLDALVAQDGAN